MQRSSRLNVDLNLALADDGSVVCRHCEAKLGTQSAPLTNALSRERPSTDAGPGIHAAPELFTDSTVVLRQRFCPSCFTLLATEIVPQEESSYRGWRLA